jgi:hypothetical protein
MMKLSYSLKWPWAETQQTPPQWPKLAYSFFTRVKPKSAQLPPPVAQQPHPVTRDKEGHDPDLTWLTPDA